MKFTEKIKASQFLKAHAREMGFQDIGIARAEELSQEAPRLEKWLKEGMHGKMLWMENHFDLRIDVRKLVEGAKSVVVFTSNYFPEEELNKEGKYKIARYAYGKDYHKVLKKRLKKLFATFREQFGEVNGRAFVDSAPVMERVWAQKAGVGWVGKNSLLLSKQKGSYFFLAVMVLDVELEYDSPLSDHCGTCTACMDACPTEAIPLAGVVDGSKCISYLTIELKENIAEEFNGKWKNWIFGCDICQEVCPWNRFSKPHSEPAFKPNDLIPSLKDKDWEDITDDIFDEVFAGSAVKRAGVQKIRETIRFLG